MQKIDLEAENREIRRQYRALLRACKPNLQKGDKKLIRQAFDMAVEAHKDMRRKSGEPYIFHPIAVAQIVAEEIGLNSTSIVCALLHDVVEDTDITLDEIKLEFGSTVAKIIDGLTKISGVFDHKSSAQAENFRKMLLTLADDVRVILIKLADRLHNMRTMDSMPRHKQLKISSETVYLYAPLAHRLGLYPIKTELEDLSLKYRESGTYNLISRKLTDSKAARTRFINEFSKPIIKKLDADGFQYKIFGRIKSINSIWNKMKNKGIPFEEVYDLFAVRIVIDSPIHKEKSDCWKAYSLVTDIYRPNPDRLRDWISTPKANGYESLHTTVMGPRGKWVEVQIRTSRMDEIAEKGFAAHWKYKEKGSDADNALDEWITNIRELLSDPEANALDFMDSFTLNLFTDEIFIFTPKGELKKLPNHATVLDFAYAIHTDIGGSCIGGKVNHKLVPISHPLKNGDQVEIITSSKQKPKEDWLNFAITAKARSNIKGSLKEHKKQIAEEGKEILERKMKSLKLSYNQTNVHKISNFLKLPNSQELFYQFGRGKIDVSHLKEYIEHKKSKAKTEVHKPGKGPAEDNVDKFIREVKEKPDEMLIIGEGISQLDYKMANCCNPIPGDDIFGFITVNEGIKIHRANCPNAVKLMSSFGYRIVKAKWTQHKEVAFLTGIKVTGIDDIGVINHITKVISSDFKVNMRSITFDSNDGVFEGSMMLFVQDTEHLEELLGKLKSVEGIISVNRYDVN